MPEHTPKYLLSKVEILPAILILSFFEEWAPEAFPSSVYIYDDGVLWSFKIIPPLRETEMARNFDYRLAREKMVKRQLIPRGIKDPRVLEAMEKAPRDRFVEEALVGEAYNDHPLPIGHNQTISQPYIVALMTEALALK